MKMAGIAAVAALIGATSASAQSIITPADLERICQYKQGLGGTAVDHRCKADLVKRPDVFVLNANLFTPELRRLVEEHFRLKLQAMREAKTN